MITKTIKLLNCYNNCMQKTTQKRHMLQISDGAYEKLRGLAFKNRRTLKAELDVILKI